MSEGNKEIKALAVIVDALDELEGEEILRIVEYVMKKYIVKMEYNKKAKMAAYNNVIKNLEKELEAQAKKGIEESESES